MSILQFISSKVWNALFGRPADSLERSIDHEDEYMIFDYNPITSNFVSVHRSVADAYLSGIIAGILEGAGFHAEVSAHSCDLEDGEAKNGFVGLPTRTDKAVFLVKFSDKILDRDGLLSNR
jgi:trafficking protein particle complex subunit 5